MTKVKEVFAYNSKLEYIDKYENYSKCCDDLQVTSQHISESVTKSKKVKGFYFFNHKPDLTFTIYKTIYNTYMLRCDDLNETYFFSKRYSDEDFLKIIKVTKTKYMNYKSNRINYRNEESTRTKIFPFTGTLEEQKLQLYPYLEKYDFDIHKMIREEKDFLDMKNFIYSK